MTPRERLFLYLAISVIVFVVIVFGISWGPDDSTNILKFTESQYAINSNPHIKYINDFFASNGQLDTITVTINNNDDMEPGISVQLTENVDNGHLSNIDEITFVTSLPSNLMEITVSAGNIIEVTDGSLSDTTTIFQPGMGVFPTTTDRMKFGTDQYRLEASGTLRVNLQNDPAYTDGTSGTDEIQIYFTSSGTPLTGGFEVTATETTATSNIFTTPVITYTGGTDVPPPDSPIKLHVEVGDKVFASLVLPTRTTTTSMNIIDSPPPAPLDTFVPPADTERIDCLVIGDDDDDADGICNSWESQILGAGLVIPYGGQTYQYVDSQGNCHPQINDRVQPGHANYGTFGTAPACPDPDKKDMYLEIDYMTGHKPATTAIFNVVQAFADNGIILHVLIDENVGFHQNKMPFSFEHPTDHTQNGFIQQKQAHLGQLSDKAGLTQAEIDDLFTAQRQVWHYLLSVHHIKETPQTSGWGEILGNDIILSMGAFTQNVGTPDEQAGTIMHELGHNAGLRHGGFEDTPNCKVNYLSVMNYLFQFPNLVSNYRAPLDFSPISMNELDETLLLETQGVQPQDPRGAMTIVGGITDSGVKLSKRSLTTGVGFDWDRSGGGLESDTISQNVHYFDMSDCRDSVKTTLTGWDDWANLNLVFRFSDEFADGIIFLETDEFSDTNVIEIRTQVIQKLNDEIQNLPDGAFDPSFAFPADAKQTLGDDLIVVESLIQNTPTDLGPAITELDTTVRADILNLLVDPYETDIITLLDEIILRFQEISELSPEADHHSPGAANQRIMTEEATPVFITLVAGDPNEGDTITYEIVAGSGPTDGKLTGFDSVAGTVTYEPDPGFVGEDSFQFMVTDNTGLKSNMATVKIKVYQSDGEKIFMENNNQTNAHLLK